MASEGKGSIFERPTHSISFVGVTLGHFYPSFFSFLFFLGGGGGGGVGWGGVLRVFNFFLTNHNGRYYLR